MKAVASAVAVFLLAGCASIPRDAGVSDVQQEIAQRTNQTVQIRQAATTDDPRIQTMLQGELTADQAVAIALVNNPEIQVALADLGLARADLLEASTVGNPILAGEIRFPANVVRPYELTLTQTILDLVYLPQRRSAGRAAFEAAKYRVASEVLAIAANVRADFYELVGTRQHLSMNWTIVEAARAATELAQRQHDAGNITDLDLENQQAMYEQAKLDVARSEEEALLWRESLIRDLALRNPSIDFKIQENFPPLSAAEPTDAEMQQLLATNRLDIAAARREVEAAQRLIPGARAAGIGDVDIGVHRERDAEGPTTTGPSFSVPIPLFNRGAANRARAEARLLQAQQRLASLLAISASQARAARQALLATRARVEYYRDVVLPRRKRIVDLTQLEQNAMVAGIFQLLQAKQNEINARRDAIDAQRDYWLARTDLDRALNGLASEPPRSFIVVTTEKRGGR